VLKWSCRAVLCFLSKIISLISMKCGARSPQF